MGVCPAETAPPKLSKACKCAISTERGSAHNTAALGRYGRWPVAGAHMQNQLLHLAGSDLFLNVGDRRDGVNHSQPVVGARLHILAVPATAHGVTVREAPDARAGTSANRAHCGHPLRRGWANPQTATTRRRQANPSANHCCRRWFRWQPLQR